MNKILKTNLINKIELVCSMDDGSILFVYTEKDKVRAFAIEYDSKEDLNNIKKLFNEIASELNN